jgi:ankyrin repeat protein
MNFKIAVSNNDTAYVQGVLQKLKINIDSVKMCDIYENTPLHYSVSLGRVKMCKILLDNGCDPNHFNKLNQTPLHLAIKHEKLDCVELLIAHGADPYIYDIKGSLPHHYANHLTTEIKKIFIDMEVDPKIKNIHLNSLAYMSSVGKIEFVSFLLEKGASPNRINKFGCTPLHLAMFNGQIDCANELLKYGAAVNSLGTVNLTPLDFYLNHVFNSIVNLFHNNNEYKSKLIERHNINLLTHLEKHHLEEFMLKLKAGCKFSSFETILLLLIRNLDSENSTLTTDQINFNAELKLVNTNQKDSASKQLINYYRKLRFLSNLLNTMLQSERNMIQVAFVNYSHESNFQNKCNNKKSIFWFLSQTYTIILNSLHQIIRFKHENKLVNGLEALDVEIRNLFFRNIEYLIKSGEMKHPRKFITEICSNWLFKKFLTKNIRLEDHDNFDYILNQTGFEYFEELFKEVNIQLSKPMSLVDICRIEVKYHIRDFPKDLEVYDSILPNSIRKFIRFENN